ncbi:MAG TPA: SDR family NAD(P)-dependent oxidoreductase [Burkholderiales bacterium]|nr:SDR family NAD(P)-dependent oxidoreductase [Burkholderiales bacterium]
MVKDVYLAGKVAVVAGASRGIGKGIAVELGAAGAMVYALGRTLRPGSGGTAGSLVETVQLIESLGGKAVAVGCDCTSESALRDVLKRVQADHGRLDAMVNSVFSAHSFMGTVGTRFWEAPVSLWNDVVDLGARSAYLASVLSAPLLIATAKAHGRPTLVLNVTGRGAVAYRYNVAYGVGKAATEKMTRDMAFDLRDHNVAAVSIWPNGAAIDPSRPETPRYSGRAVAHLLADPNLMAKTGAHFWSADLGKEYGFTDEFGNAHSAPALADDFVAKP